MLKLPYLLRRGWAGLRFSTPAELGGKLNKVADAGPVPLACCILQRMRSRRASYTVLRKVVSISLLARVRLLNCKIADWKRAHLRRAPVDHAAFLMLQFLLGRGGDNGARTVCCVLDGWAP
jgi:hypothetical protein